MPVGEYSVELTTLTSQMLTENAADRPTVQDILQTEIMKNTQLRYELCRYVQRSDYFAFYSKYK